MSNNIQQALQHKINTKTKPLGALGVLEDIALKIGEIQKTTTPQLNKPTMMVFAGDHGVVKSKSVSPFPQEVTAQMVFNFLQGGAAINVFCNQNGIDLQVIDAGVNFDFEPGSKLIDAKVNRGTKDYSVEPAMSIEDCKKAVSKGEDLVTKQFSQGTNVIGFGEMGIGNTSAAALLMSAYTTIAIEECVGKGTGVDAEGLKNKISILKEVQAFHGSKKEALEILATFGGYEIAMMAGAFLQAYRLNMTIIVDGFIVTSALLAAHAIEPKVLDNCVFSHCSNEQGHQKMLTFLQAKAVLNLGLRLGEGTGVALVYPLIESSVNFLNQMSSFEDAGVSNTDE